MIDIDFTLYTLAFDETREARGIPGMLVLSPPRNACRHRKEDLLAIFVIISGEHRYGHMEISVLVQESANQFFQTQGSVTRAMQNACDWVNRKILETNIEQAYEGIQALGSMNLAVLHQQWIFLAQYGNAFALRLSAERFDSFGMTQEATEFLGQMKRVQLRFYQSVIEEGDLLILSGQPPMSWTAANLAGSHLLSAPALKRRLLSQAPIDFKAMVIRCTKGSGRVVAGRWEGDKIMEEMGNNIEGMFTPSIRTQSLVETTDTGTLIDTQPKQAEQDQIITQSEPDKRKGDGYKPDIIKQNQDEGEIPVLAGETERAVLGDKRISPSCTLSMKNPFLLAVARLWMNGRTFLAKFRLMINKLQPRFIKRQPIEDPPKTPLLLMFLALIFPVSVVIMSISIYTRTGKMEQYETYFKQAQQTYNLAENEKDQLKKRSYYAQTVELASKAEEFNVTRDSRLLFEQAQYLMDEMDLAARLEFRPALTSFLPQGVVIRRIRSSFSGLYLLDETSGSVLRLILNPKGFYELDGGFKCSPGPYGLVTVTPLIDFITLPANEDDHRIAAIDGQGNLLYCRSDKPPISNTLTPPEGGWGRITALGYEQDTLYVLDSQNSEIWMYAGKDPKKMDKPNSTGIYFVESPIRFLDENIPDLKGGIDMAINQQELYVLHEDGHMTLCRYSPMKEVRLTECHDPSPYTDNRVGREDRKPWIFMNAHFTRMQDLKVPTLSIFILDTLEPSVYQFSFQLNLERTLRITKNKSFPMPESPPSGFGVTPDMELILAYDNRLYLAPMR